MHRRELPEGCSIVPGKAVFTVKPDKSGYRRKTRLVACGNHIPADQLLGELYAAGVDAVSLRTLLLIYTSSLCPGTLVWQPVGDPTSFGGSSDEIG